MGVQQDLKLSKYVKCFPIYRYYHINTSSLVELNETFQIISPVTAPVTAHLSHSLCIQS